MKKLFGVMFLALVLSFPVSAWAVGSVTQSVVILDHTSFIVRFVCIGDAAAGSIPNTSTDNGYYPTGQTTTTITDFITGKTAGGIGSYLYEVRAYPTSGGTAPDEASVFILQNGRDLLGSVDGGTTAYRGSKLIHATLEMMTGGDYYNLGLTTHSPWHHKITGALTLKVIDQATASADWTVDLVFVR